MTQITDPSTIRDAVRTRYAAAATAIARATTSSDCCSAGASCCGSAPDASDISSALYSIDEVGELPTAAVLASLGCGNPTALAELKAGEIVLDLGSGGGIDVLLSARRVGPTGFVYGLDMTDEMIALANRNANERDVQNVRFLKGEIEHIPLPDASVDVVISNCVINLSADKPQVLRETFRVLKPGGRFAVSDVVVQGTLPRAIRGSMDAWAVCLAGALEEREYRSYLADAGFTDVDVEVNRVYGTEQGCCGDSCSPQDAAFSALVAVGGRLVSAFVRATKSASESSQ
ncbi:MAG: arsenite methyltransferase [Chloroflexi bacterium]|nr:arsenite methyltransferase [Chloroflexota bacterium]